MRVAVCALVAVLVLGAGTASAGGRKHDFEVGAYGGYGWLDEFAPVLPKNAALAGGRIGYFVSRHWSFEVSGQRLFSKRDTVVDSKVNLDALRGNVFFNFDAEGMVRPFLTIGMGWEKFDPADFPQFESKDAGFNAGAGVRVFFNEHLGLRLDGRFVHFKADRVGDTAHNYEATAGLSAYFGGHEHVHEEEEVHAAAPPPPPPNGAPTVTCSAERPEILPGETVQLTASASDPDGDALTYEWSTNSGHVTGTGPTVTLDFTGVTGPTSATATVRVSDGHDHTASCDIGVRLGEAQKQAESVSCLAGGFPRNAARLTNVDKACLDDVVQKLRSDPRAHVVVIGHADTHETTKERVGQQRADAVKTYLVSAGVEGARVTTRSAGDSHPVATGTDVASMSQNRRCEVWFVPEGAKEPE